MTFHATASGRPEVLTSRASRGRRTTADADAIVFVSPAEAESLVRRAAEAGFNVRTEVERERLATTGTMRFRRGKFQIDLITASLPFEETAYGQERRPRVA